MILPVEGGKFSSLLRCQALHTPDVPAGVMAKTRHGKISAADFGSHKAIVFFSKIDYK